MMAFNIRKKELWYLLREERGLALVIALIVGTVALAVGLSLLNVTLRQFILSGVARDSEIAFHAAYAGIECARYEDVQNDSFAVGGGDVTINCMSTNETYDDGNDNISSGEEQTYEFDWGQVNSSCTELSVYKFDASSGDETIPGAIIGGSTPADNRTCSDGNVCTVIQSRGYNVTCAERTSNIRSIEREVVIIY